MRRRVSRETQELLRRLHAEAGELPHPEQRLRVQRDIETVARLTKILFGASDPPQSADGED